MEGSRVEAEDALLDVMQASLQPFPRTNLSPVFVLNPDLAAVVLAEAVDVVHPEVVVVPVVGKVSPAVDRNRSSGAESSVMRHKGIQILEQPWLLEGEAGDARDPSMRVSLVTLLGKGTELSARRPGGNFQKSKTGVVLEVLLVQELLSRGFRFLRTISSGSLEEVLREKVARLLEAVGGNSAFNLRLWGLVR